VKRTILSVALSLALAGCANIRFQWAASYATDNVLADLERAAKPSEPTK